MDTPPGAGAPIPAAHDAHAPTTCAPRARLLFVCTGNICRSAAARVIAARLLAPLGVDVDCAGTRALVGHGLDADMADALRERGWTDLEHQAKQATGRWLATGTLIVAFGPEHARWIVDERPDLRRAVLAFGALERVAARGQDGLTLARVHHVARALAAEEADWVADPYRRGPQAAARSAARIESTLRAFAQCLS